MQVNVSDICGRYRIKLDEVRRAIDALIKQPGGDGLLREARSEAASLQVHFDTLILKHYAAAQAYLTAGQDAVIKLDEVEAMLVETIDTIYEDVAAALR